MKRGMGGPQIYRGRLGRLGEISTEGYQGLRRSSSVLADRVSKQ